MYTAKEARSVEDRGQGLSHQYASVVHKLAVPPSNSTQILLSTYVSSDIFSNTFSILRFVFLFYLIKYEFGDQAYRNILNFTSLSY
jgi:hypothetical protein